MKVLEALSSIERQIHWQKKNKNKIQWKTFLSIFEHIQIHLREITLTDWSEKKYFSKSIFHLIEEKTAISIFQSISQLGSHFQRLSLIATCGFNMHFRLYISTTFRTKTKANFRRTVSRCIYCMVWNFLSI